MSEALSAACLLGDLVVVELGDRMAVGACGGLMARTGAKVILVEPTAREARCKWQQRPTIAAGKLSIALDPAVEGDKDVLRSLVDAADIVLLSSDLTPWNAEFLTKPRPDQIVCDITGFGHTGPLAGRACSEGLLQAVSGVADTTGHPDGPPAVTGAPFLEMETAVYATAAILAAQRARRRSGAGQVIDMAIYDVAVNALLTFIPLHLVGRPSTRTGNRHPLSVPWNSYRAANGWVLICGPTDDQWRRLCTAMGSPQLVEDQRFATSTARLENVDALDAVIGTWVAGQEVVQCIEQVSAHGIPASSLVALEDLAAEPNLRKRAQVLPVRDPDAGAEALVAGTPIRVAGQQPLPPPVVPARDQDRAAVLAIASSPRRGTASPAVRRAAGRALEDIRVIEIGMNTVAPLATKQLGALGADVIKLEPPRGDTTRHNAPLRSDGQAFLFALSNTDKRGIVLDLRQSSDLAVLWQLLASADIVIENLKPGSLAKLGVGAEDVLGRFPEIIYCSINGFGFHTAYPGRPALDTVIQAMSGAMSATVLDGVPTKAGISISDQLGGQFGLAAVLAALEYRARTGKGMHLDLAMQDCSAWATQMIWNGRAGPAVSMLQCADGYVAIEGLPEGSQSTSGLSRDELGERLGERAAPVLTVAEVLDHPQTKARELLKVVPTADGGGWLVLESPLRLLATPAKVRSSMPRLGFLDPQLAKELGLRPAAATSRTVAPTFGA